MAEVESKAEAMGVMVGTWILFQEEGKTTEGFRQESTQVFLTLCLPLVRMFCFLRNWYSHSGGKFGFI